MQTPVEAEIVEGWIQKNYIFVPGDEDKQIMKLNQKHKMELMKGICPIQGIDRNSKFQMLDQILGSDKSDQAIGLRIYCKASLPELAEKVEAWNELMNQQSRMSKAQKEQLIAAFLIPGQEQITNQFSGKLFF